MRVILRDAKSGVYYKGEGKWTRVIEAARDYKSTSRAVETATEVGRASLEIVLAFDDPFFNLTLPVGKSFGWEAAHGKGKRR